MIATHCSQTPLSANIALNSHELKSLGTVPFVFLLDCASQGISIERDRIGFGAKFVQVIVLRPTPLSLSKIA